MRHDCRSSVRASAFVVALVSVTAVALLRAASPPVRQAQVFRATVDYIAVDVQVIDKDGRPVDRLGPEKFEASIGGKRRRVVNAAFVRNAPTDKVATDSVPSPSAAPSAAPGTEAPGRTFMVAIDEGSLDMAESRGVAGAVATFIRQLEPNDLVGVYSYPLGPWILPTTNHAGYEPARRCGGQPEKRARRVSPDAARSGRHHRADGEEHDGREYRPASRAQVST